MAGLKFTADWVERLPYRPSEAGWCVHWHHKLKGFGLRITESGARAYIVRYRLQGSRSQRLRTLGSLSVLKFGQAMERARAVLREAEVGRDWFDEVKRTRAQTLGQVWTYYFREHASTDALSERSRGELAFLWRKYSQREFEHSALADVTAERARDWHRRVSKGTPYGANRSVQALRAAWNFGLKYGCIPREMVNPFADVTLNRERPRQVILEPHCVPAFAKAINGLENPYARGYLWLLFYTGCRRTELLNLEWTDVELLPARKSEPRRGTILLRQTKGGEPRRVALSEPAIEILEALPQTENRYVFIGAIKDTHLDPKQHWQTAREAAGLPELRMHDLRRSFGSWLGASGFTSKQIGATLGHKTDITSRVYMQLGEAAGIKRQLVDAHAALAREFAIEKPLAEVTEIGSRAKA